VGVSADKPEVQQRFIDKFGLTFPMIADTDKSIIEDYGTRKVLGMTAERTTFLIDPDGRIARIWRMVKVQGHADEVVAEIERLRAGG
jgi:thioredoxin-dependent peroxiredoxin